MSYPDVVIACIEHKVFWNTQSNWGRRLVKHDNKYEGLFPGGWLITITANHSNYLVQDRANTQSVTARKVVTATHYCNASYQVNLQYRPVRKERGMFILHHF